MTGATELDVSPGTSDTTESQQTVQDNVIIQELASTSLASPEYDPSEISSASPVSAFFRQEYLQFPSSLRSSYPSTVVSSAEVPMQWSPTITSSLIMPSFLAGLTDEFLTFSPKESHQIYEKSISDSMTANNQLASVQSDESSQSPTTASMNQISLQFPFSDGFPKFINPFDNEFRTHLSHDRFRDVSQMTESFFQHGIVSPTTSCHDTVTLQALLPFPSIDASHTLLSQTKLSSSRQNSEDHDRNPINQGPVQQDSKKPTNNDLPKEIDGIEVNPEWGLTKAGKARQRLPIACLTCRSKKIRCIRDTQTSGACENCLKSVALRDSCRTEERPRPRRSSLPAKAKAQTGRVHKRRSSTQYARSPPKLDASASSSYSTDIDKEIRPQSTISDRALTSKPLTSEVVHIIPGKNVDEVIADNNRPYLNKLHTSPMNLASPLESPQESEAHIDDVQDIQTITNARNFEIYNDSGFDSSSLPVEDTIAGLSENLADPIFFQAVTDSVNVMQ